MSFKEFKEFVKNAETRCGVSFELKTVQKNMEGVITAVKGQIFLLNEQRESVPQEMLWNLKGQAMLIGEQFDLVVGEAFEDVADDAPILQAEK
jgi:hypothetical protein